MKIIMIFGNPIGEFYGGISTHVKYLSKYIQRETEIDLVLVTFGRTNSISRKNNVEYIELKRMKYGKIFYPFEIFYDLLRIERIINNIKPDLIHLQGTSPNFSLLGIFLKKKYPVLITLHGYFAEEYKIHTGWRKIIYRLFCAPLEKIALSQIPNIIVLSPHIKNLINKDTNSKIFTIPNGVDLKYIQTISSYEKKEYQTVFFLGYLTKGKGVEDLIRAISLVKKKVTNVQLFIGGTGPEINKLKELVMNLHLDKEVIFLGLLNEKEKFAYMKSMDIFVLPSYWESFPMVLLEAMACRKPIITTNVGGNPFAVINGLNGFLVQPGNLHELSEKMITLLNDKNLCKKMGEESFRRGNDFDWNIIVKQTIDTYKIIYINTNE